MGQAGYQSAGIGRNRQGQFLAFGPFSIQQLDADAGELSTLAEDRRYDYLAPQALPDGSLLFIRRPYSKNEVVHPVRVLQDICLFPFRLVYAVVHLSPDGRIFYNNGNAVFLLHPEGQKERLLTEAMIEQVCFIAT